MKKIFYLFILLFITVACEQTIENEDSIISESNITGEWTVNAYIDNNIVFGPFTVTTQLNAENESVSLKDNGEFWKFQTKAELLETNNTFAAKSSVNEICNVGAKINIIDGSIINKDSIEFNIQFEDDEERYGNTYKIMGHRN